MALTVVIPTFNEEEDLPRTLNSVQFADEILVVDSGSSDHTVEIAKAAGARVILHPFSSFADSRNFADKKAKSDWILSLEADVVVPDNLAQEIKDKITNPQVDAFYLPRINIIWGKPILYADWGPTDDCHIRLYQKGAGKWHSQVHEQYLTDRPTAKMKNPLLHYNYETVSEFITKTDAYSTPAAAQAKMSPSLWLAPSKDFFKRYIYKRGFLAGYHGLFLCYLQAIYHLNVLVKLKAKSYAA